MNQEKCPASGAVEVGSPSRVTLVVKSETERARYEGEVSIEIGRVHRTELYLGDNVVKEPMQ
jgi:hypothetical protein